MNTIQLTEPLHHLSDPCEVFLLFFLWVGIIIPQVAYPIVCLQEEIYLFKLHRRALISSLLDGERRKRYLCIAEVEVDGFGVSNVKDAVGLRRKTSANLKGIYVEG